MAILAAVLSACGKPAPDNMAAATADSDTVAGQRIAADYLKQHGGAIDACFVPPPAIRGPGAIQTVTDDAGPDAAAINRLVIAIDASGSMATKSGDGSKMDAAKRAAIAFLGDVPANTQIGLVAFGHRGTNLPSGKAASCRGVESIYPLGSANRSQVETALRQVRPTGWTPLAAAITVAGQSFTPSSTPGAQVVYVVSDGLETCGGDPVAAARSLNQGPVKAIVNIIGFDLAAADRAQLSAVASAGGGTFVEAKSGGDVARAMDEVRRNARKASAMTTEHFDAGARSTDNNFAVGKYTTDLNFCVAHATSAEMAGLQRATDAAHATIPESEAARAVLRQRHATYSDRSAKIAADLLAKSKAANDAIAAQQHRSEERLRIDP